jgi:hypothetical protein
MRSSIYNAGTPPGCAVRLYPSLCQKQFIALGKKRPAHNKNRKQYACRDREPCPLKTLSTGSTNGDLRTSETCSADTNGVFTDLLFIGCNSVGGSCGVTFTHQQWLWCPPNGAAVVIATPGDLIIHDNEVSVGGNTARFATGTCIYASGLVVNPCI